MPQQYQTFQLRLVNPFKAIPWFKNGDHPEDASTMITDGISEPFLTEGKVVRRFNHPEVPGDSTCPSCGKLYHDHGFIEPNLISKYISEEIRIMYGVVSDGIVCPGNWILTSRDRTYSIISDQLFNERFVEVPYKEEVSSSK